MKSEEASGGPPGLRIYTRTLYDVLQDVKGMGKIVLPGADN